MTLLERLAAIAGRAGTPTRTSWRCSSDSRSAPPTKAEQRGAAEALAALAQCRAGRRAAARAGAGRRRRAASLGRGVCLVAPRHRSRRRACRCCWTRWAPTTATCAGRRRRSSAQLRAHPAEVVAALRALLGSASPLQRKMALYCLRDLGASRRRRSSGRARGALDDAERPSGWRRWRRWRQLADGSRGGGTRRGRDGSTTRDAGVRRAAAAALGRLGRGRARE